MLCLTSQILCGNDWDMNNINEGVRKAQQSHKNFKVWWTLSVILKHLIFWLEAQTFVPSYELMTRCELPPWMYNLERNLSSAERNSRKEILLWTIYSQHSWILGSKCHGSYESICEINYRSTENITYIFRIHESDISRVE